MQEAHRNHLVNRVIRTIWEGPPHATYRPKLAEPPEIFTYDPAENRRSIRKLADLNPSLILPGHGPAVTDIAAFERFVAALPE